jgi:SAM-dependent methyltransferase
VEGFDASTYGERFADVYDEWYADVSDVEGTADLVARLAGGGPVLELGIGTGRLALPIAARGVEVHGIDASPAMVERLRAKPGGADLPVTLGDFADVGASTPGGYAVVLVAFNTLFNLATADAQRRCVANVADRLRPGGSFVVEAFVPDPEPSGDGGRVVPSVIDSDRVVLQVTRRDADAQTVSGNTVTITERGIRLRPWLIRYAAPAELDAMATAAGLDLVERWSDWRGSAFDDESSRHVTVYRKSPE